MQPQLSAPISPLIEMDSASLNFGGGAGVFDLTLSLPPGSILGLIGPSGCGKTTTVRLLTGLYRPGSGRVRVFGQNPAAFTNVEKSRIGYLPQQLILHPHLNAEENLIFLGGLYGLSHRQCRERMESLLDFMDLIPARRRLAWQLSGGMKRRLMLAGTLLHDPELLFADEPTAGIDPILRARIWDRFHQLSREGRTVVMTTQYVGEAEYCDLIAVMRAGRLVALNSPEGLRRQVMGGDLIHLEFDDQRVNIYEVMGHLAELPQVKKVEQIEKEKGGLYVYVGDAGQEFSGLLNCLREQHGIIPQLAERYLPSFNDVFIRLIQKTVEEQV